MFPNLWRGLWVLGTELYWTFGKGAGFARHLASLRKRRAALQAQIERMGTEAPGAASLHDELALLEQDLEAVARERETAHQTHLAPLRRRFPNIFD